MTIEQGAFFNVLESIGQGTRDKYIYSRSSYPSWWLGTPMKTWTEVLEDLGSPDWEGDSYTSCASGSDESCVPSYTDGAASWWTLELQRVMNCISSHLTRPQWNPCVQVLGGRGSSPDGLQAVTIPECTLQSARWNPAGCCLKQRSRSNPHPERQGEQKSGLYEKRSKEMAGRRETDRTRCRVVENTHEWREWYGNPLYTTSFLLPPFRWSRESGRDDLSRIGRSESPYQHAVQSKICSEIILILNIVNLNNLKIYSN